MPEFDQTLASVLEGRAQVPEGWGQGRATFGGMVAALMYRALEQRLEVSRPVRSLMISFVAPVAPGPLELEVTQLRAGKSSSQLQCVASQGEHVAAVMLASFGAARESAIRVVADPPPAYAPPEQCQALPYIAGVVPEFTRHFEFRWAEGDLPFARSSRGDIGGWVRFREEAAQAGVPYLLGLVDAWPPAVLPMFRAPAPISSLTWSLDFPSGSGPQSAGDWWQYRAVTDQAGDGYALVGARFWNSAGELVAVSRQAVSLFA